MTSLPVQATSDSELDTIFAPIFERITTGAVDREIDRRLPYHEIDWLRAANFGALRVPVEFGGYSATVRQIFRLLIDLAAAESNIPQALRVHFTFVEDRLLDEPGAKREHWLRAVGDGVLVGNAITEPGVGAVDRYRTRLTRDGNGWRLNGIKYYSTGSLLADHILTAADRDGERVGVLVDADADGVRRHDDWDGFGQRLTASGTTEFSDVLVDDDRILGPGYGVCGTHLRHGVSPVGAVVGACGNRTARRVRHANLGGRTHPQLHARRRGSAAAGPARAAGDRATVERRIYRATHRAGGGGRTGSGIGRRRVKRG